jgi:hypothetical protein
MLAEVRLKGYTTYLYIYYLLISIKTLIPP